MLIYYSSNAERQLCSLPIQVHDRILDKLMFFASQDNVFFYAKKLTDRDGYSLRVGDYRIICDIGDGVISVLKVEKRDKVYD